jgi:hypothetical protein
MARVSLPAIQPIQQWASTLCAESGDRVVTEDYRTTGTIVTITRPVLRVAIVIIDTGRSVECVRLHDRESLGYLTLP